MVELYPERTNTGPGATRPLHAPQTQAAIHVIPITGGPIR
jgi:hypothetical protein